MPSIFTQLLYIFQKYGYIIIFTGTFFEGETTLVLGGLLSHHGSLSFWPVIWTATTASYIGHVVFYFLGKTASPKILIWFPRIDNKINQAEFIIRRYEILSLFITQYIFGIRLASAMAFGILNMKISKFLALQFISCLTWAILFASLGYWLGESCEPIVKNMEKAILIILVLGFIVALIGRKIIEYFFPAKPSCPPGEGTPKYEN